VEAPGCAHESRGRRHVGRGSGPWGFSARAADWLHQAAFPFSFGARALNNRRMRGVKTLWLAFALLLLVGCQHPGPRFDPYALNGKNTLDLQELPLTNQISQQWLQPPTKPFTLGPGDRLELELVDDPTSRTPSVVGPDGKIYFDLLPGVDVWGLTLPQAKAELEKQLQQYYKEQPRVSLTLRGVESRRIWILGRVQAPGVYYMTNSPTLLEMITEAGGALSLAGSRDLSINNYTEEQADLSRAFIVRRGRMLPVDFDRLIRQGDMSQNIYVEPDDFVYFPGLTARTVYVIGAVALPRAVPYTAGMTMAGAIANAGGPIAEAFLSHTAVVRGSLSQPKIALVDYRAVVTGKVPDPVLQPHDIVYIPFEPFRYLVRYGDLIMNTFVSSVMINEGIHVVDSHVSTPAGVFIPVGSHITVTPTGPVIGPGPSSPVQ